MPSQIMSRKIAGVPVVYIAGGAVFVLAIIAWRAKSTPAAPEQQQAAPEDTTADDATPPAVYPEMPKGTVVAASPTDNADSNTSISSNAEWLKRGVMFLSEKGGESPGEAHLALSAYLDGNQLTYQQGIMRDKVIRELGMPPDPPTPGTTAPDVGRSQGPLPRAHTVKNVNENSAAKLAMIYYNRSDAFAVSAITSANSGRSTYNVGDAVQVPILPTPVAPAKPAVPTKAPVVNKPPAAAKPPAKRTYKVKTGDTLWGIASRYYGNGTAYTRIKQANGLRSDIIHTGQVLVIP